MNKSVLIPLLSDTVKHKYVHLSYSRTPSLHLWWQWEPQRLELTVTPQPSQFCRPVGWTAPETQSKQHRGGNRRWRRRPAGGATEAVALPQRPRSQQGGGKGRLLPVVMKHIYLIYIKWCIFFPCGVIFFVQNHTKCCLFLGGLFYLLSAHYQGMQPRASFLCVRTALSWFVVGIFFFLI